LYLVEKGDLSLQSFGIPVKVDYLLAKNGCACQQFIFLLTRLLD